MADSPVRKCEGRWVEISFDCVPMRTVSRVDVPVDASPKFAAKLNRLREAIEKHGTLNTYYLHNARCVYFLTNDPMQGMMQFDFEGVVFTDESDMKTRSCELRIELTKETCNWLNQGIVDWFAESVKHSVLVEFDRFIKAGDFRKTLERVEKLQKEAEQTGGFVGMYL